MENNAQNQLRVGLFLAAGLVAILTTILLLGGDRALLKRHVTIYATMDNVQGLNKGSVVSLSGFTVGNIKEITFSPEKKSLVLKLCNLLSQPIQANWNGKDLTKLIQ